MLLSALELVLSAAALPQDPDKARMLRAANAKIDATKLLVRLGKDCRCMTNAAYLDMESRLHDAGSMLGGWIKSSESKGRP